MNIPGYAYTGREPYSYINRVEQRYQFTDNFSWTLGRHATKFGVDFNYINLDATFTVNYGGIYDFGPVPTCEISSSLCIPGLPIPGLSPVQAYGAGLPQDFVQGFGSPTDSFPNKPLGVFWQDSWHKSPNLTLNYGLRYDIEFPPQFAPPTGLALGGYNYSASKKESRLPPTTSSPVSAWHGTPRATARPCSAPPTEFSSITPCSASTSSATPPMVPPAASWPSAAPGMRRRRQPRQSQRHSHLSRPAFGRSQRSQSLRRLNQSRSHHRHWIFAQPATVRVAEFPPIDFSQPELLERGNAFPAGVSALRLSPGQRFCLRLLAAG